MELHINYDVPHIFQYHTFAKQSEVSVLTISDIRCKAK